MRIYLDTLSHVQVVIKCRYSVAQMRTCEDTLTHNLGAPCIDDVMSYNSLTKTYYSSALDHKDQDRTSTQWVDEKGDLPSIKLALI